jgi:hypothetical protein
VSKVGSGREAEPALELGGSERRARPQRVAPGASFASALAGTKVVAAEAALLLATGAVLPPDAPPAPDAPAPTLAKLALVAPAPPLPTLKQPEALPVPPAPAAEPAPMPDLPAPPPVATDASAPLPLADFPPLRKPEPEPEPALAPPPAPMAAFVHISAPAPAPLPPPPAPAPPPPAPVRDALPEPETHGIIAKDGAELRLGDGEDALALRITADKHIVHVHVHGGADAALADVLRSSADELREALAVHGLELGELSASTDGGTAHQPHGHDPPEPSGGEATPPAPKATKPTRRRGWVA